MPWVPEGKAKRGDFRREPNEDIVCRLIQKAYMKYKETRNLMLNLWERFFQICENNFICIKKSAIKM